MKLLLIEDEKKTASYIDKGLTENGFVVDTAGNGVDGLHLAMTGEYDVIVLDLLLPVVDGTSVIKELRKAEKRTRILVLSAKGDVEDRVRALETGADAVLTKPFVFSELLATLRALLRRQGSPRAEVLKVEDLEIDPLTHRATRNKKRLDLTPKEFNLLYLLSSREGEVLSRTLIAEQIWSMNYDCDTNVVDVHIRRLRSKVDDPFEKKLIQTIRGVGYVVRAENSSASEISRH